MPKTIEFKYERTPENTIMQMAGKLIGLRALNNSNIIPTLEGSILTLEVKGLAKEFFTAGRRQVGHVDTGREAAYDTIKQIFGQVDVWVKIEDEGSTTKRIINPDADIRWIGDHDKLTVLVDTTEAPAE